MSKQRTSTEMVDQRRAFLRGFGSILSLFPPRQSTSSSQGRKSYSYEIGEKALARKLTEKSGAQRDAESLQSDWKKVGEYLYFAIDHAEKALPVSDD